MTASDLDFPATIRRMEAILDNGGVDRFREAFVGMLADMRACFRAEEERLADDAHPAAAEHAVEHKVLLHMASHVAKMTAVTADVQYVKFSFRSIAALLSEHLLRDQRRCAPASMPVA